MRNFTGRVVTAPIPVSLLLRLATYGLLRSAQVRDDAKLLPLADRWADRAATLAPDPSAFYNDAIQITPHVVGYVSPYHTGYLGVSPKWQNVPTPRRTACAGPSVSKPATPSR